jgi:hypothetical protein
MKNTNGRQCVIDEYTKQIADTIDMEALSNLTTSAMSNEDNPELDGLVDRIVKLAESISKESREAGNYIPIRDATLMDIVNTEMENK